MPLDNGMRRASQQPRLPMAPASGASRTSAVSHLANVERMAA